MSALVPQAGLPRDPAVTRPQVVIIGGGFAGLEAAKALERLPVQVTLVDRENHHLFQPLLYQVATAGLSPADIAIPIRSVLRKHTRTWVLMGLVERIDIEGRLVHIEGGSSLSYDYLIIAAGARTSYFGHDDWQAHAPGLKSIRDAIEIRRRILTRFEEAERESNPERVQKLLTFVVIGAGPTGVELAGSFAELGRRVLAKDFRAVEPESVRVILLEGGDRVLPGFRTELSAAGARQLRELGVEIRTDTMVRDITESQVHLDSETIEAGAIVWAAGVGANPLTRNLPFDTDRSGRIMVQPDCSVPGHPEVFALGDIAHFADENGTPLPGVSPVAMQQGRYVADAIGRSLAGLPTKPFEYFDKGMMATVGRSRAVAQSGSMYMTGFLAWLAWLFVHIFYLVGFKNRVFVLLSWIWSYLFDRRGARLIAAPSSPTEGRS